MGDFGLDPETVLKLLRMLLLGATYYFAGFAVLGLSTYVVFLWLEIFASRPRAKARTAEAPQPPECACVAEQAHDLVSAQTPILVEEATVTGGGVRPSVAPLAG